MVYAAFEKDRYTGVRRFAGVITAPNFAEARKVADGMDLSGGFEDEVKAEQYADSVISQEPIVCSLCEITTVKDVETAIEEGWLPDWWDKHDNQHAPICPSCAMVFTELGKDGETQLVGALDQTL